MNVATLSVNTILSSSGDISFAKSVDGGTTVGGGVTLSVNTPGVTKFSGAVGGGTRLASLTTDTAGSTEIAGGRIATTGAQSYGDAVTLDANTTLSSNSVGNISFAKTLKGGFTLAVNTSGATKFSAAVGGGSPSTSLSTDAGGSTEIAGGTVDTTGGQSYGDAVTLSANTTLTSTGSGDIRFLSTVDGAFRLAVNTSGITTFGGRGRRKHPAGPGHHRRARHDGDRRVHEHHGRPDLRRVRLPGADVTLTDAGPQSTGIAFLGTVDTREHDSAFADGHLEQAQVFQGAVGHQFALNALTTDVADPSRSASPTELNGGEVRTVLGQTYRDAVKLGAAVMALSSTGVGDIHFVRTVDGASQLTVTTSGVTTFDG